MAEELSSPNHYVSCTGDYDCAADEHIDGCFIFDKRAVVEQQHDPYDTAERDLVEYIRKHRAVLDTLIVQLDQRVINWSCADDRQSIYVSVLRGYDGHDNRYDLDG